MGNSLHILKSQLFEQAEKYSIKDPLTECVPMSERALTGLLCLYAQLGKVRWAEVPLYDVQSFQPDGRASHLISSPGSFVAEYILLHRNKDEEGTWGGMPADLLYVSGDTKSVVMFENKIGSDITYEPTPKSNQLARQLDYLISLQRDPVAKVSLILISMEKLFELDWYRKEFAAALDYNARSTQVSGYLMTWEDLFRAMK